MKKKYLFEEEIYVEGTDMLLKYSLSNDLDEILNEIYSRTGYEVDSKNLDWKLNPLLSVSVINLMNKHEVDYSMTTYLENDTRNVVINRRVDDKWFLTGFGLNNNLIQNRKEQYNSYDEENVSNTSSMGIVGCIMGIINIFNVILVIANRDSIISSFSGDAFLPAFAWFIITVVIAITGFFVSKSGHSKGEEGAGIAGMALNGLVILPAMIFLIGAFTSSSKDRRR